MDTAEFLESTQPIHIWQIGCIISALHKKGKLLSEQIESMNGIGFEWELRTYVPLGWDERFEQLKEYKQVNGNCNVSTYDEDNPKLGNWVDRQRQLYRKNKLSPDRFELLHTIGFEWQLSRGSKSSVGVWNERFKELIQFNEEHGHCNVPHKYKANPELGVWVTTQRTAKKGKGTYKISPEQINRLEGIGFKWVLGRGYKPTWKGLDAAETENLVSGGEDTSLSRDTQIMIPLHRLPPIVWPATKSTNP